MTRSEDGSERQRADARSDHQRGEERSDERDSPVAGAVVQLRSSIGSAATSSAFAGPAIGSGPDLLAAPIGALAELGLDAVRIPLDWARVEPTQGRFDGATLDAYDRIFETAGVPLWLTLMEGEVPQWFDDAGNFADATATARYWPRFVELVADRFGDRVAGWVPLERPVQFARAAFGDGTFPPRRRDPKVHAAVASTLLEAWRDAWTILRGRSPVMMSLDLQRIAISADPDEAGPEPGKRSGPGEAEAARRWDQMVWQLWPTARRDGVIDVPGYPARRVEALESSGDGVVAWLPAAGPDAAWIGELIRRLDDLVECPIHAVIRFKDPAHGDHTARCFEQIADARNDGIAINGVWAAPAMGPNGLLDAGSTPLPAAEDWITEAKSHRHA
jgi:hypothetical protein